MPLGTAKLVRRSRFRGPKRLQRLVSHDYVTAKREAIDRSKLSIHLFSGKCRYILMVSREIRMARTASLSSMSVDELLKLREDVGKVLSQKTSQLQDQLRDCRVRVPSAGRADEAG